MSAERVPVDDPEVLRRILANASALLLDFDGPVCGVFSGLPAHLVAHQLRGVLVDGGHVDLPAEIEKAEDPFDVMRYAASLGNDEARYVEATMRAHEVEAVATAIPTLGAHELIKAWHASARKLAIVSNNSVAAVQSYLHLHKLATYVDVVSARTEPDPSLLKPSPFLLDQACIGLGIAATTCVLLGDSVADVVAARAGHAPVVAYANKSGKVQVLMSQRPDVITTSVARLVSFLAK